MKSSVLSEKSPDIFSEPFTEEEVSAYLEAIYETVNGVRFAKDEPVPKTILIDLFGTQKSMKTSVTGKIEQVFRRHKFRAYCPPETAEHEGIRSLTTDDPVIEQAKHLSGVRDQYLYLSNHPRAHVAITSRGLKDMLYWYEKGLRKGIYSETHVQSIKNEIYQLLSLDLVDAYFFFTCSVETAIRREYECALTQKRGSKMNEKDISETIDIYIKVLEGVEKNVPGLPIFHVDTSDMDLRQAGEEVLKYLLPTICSRFNVPEGQLMTRSLSLVKKRARHSPYFEEQLKFRGQPSIEKANAAGWTLEKTSYQEDTYFVLPNQEQYDPRGEVLRLRHEGGDYKLMYKGPARDTLISHRSTLSFKVNSDEAKKECDRYKTLVVLKKTRSSFRNTGVGSDDHFFTLHIDSIEGLGDFTEIRARGSFDKMHTSELLNLAHQLGFGMSTMIEGTYLSLALSSKS